TFDGRIKPEVVAPGVSIYAVSPNSPDGYRTGSGTSFSCPLVSGVAALILQAHPYLKPEEVLAALKETASQSQSPDNDFGWGVVNAHEAIFFHGLFFSDKPVVIYNNGTNPLVKIKVFSKYQLLPDALWLHYAINNNEFQQTKLRPSLRENEYQAYLPSLENGDQVKAYFSAKDENNDHKFFPHLAPQVYFSFVAFDTTFNESDPVPEDYQLFQNYPNPFQRITNISYGVAEPGQVSLTIFNILGQRVKVLAEEFHPARQYVKYWDGRDDHGNYVSAGLYFYQLRAENATLTKRLVYWGVKK
ncbi:MAG: S8 family serine peptidase, partial [bacterium]|nr:S8 family serine peptidase [bacterium]